MANLLHTEMARIARDIDQLFDAVLTVPDDARKILADAMRHAAIGGGKRLRPLLVCAAADLFAVDRACALRAGLAIEAIHVYSLIHDDLPAMDDDDMRRGKPTVHKAFDEATAILAGDALLTYAFDILADGETKLAAEAKVALTLKLARASGLGGMAGGQMLDLQAERRHRMKLASSRCRR